MWPERDDFKVANHPRSSKIPERPLLSPRRSHPDTSSQKRIWGNHPRRSTSCRGYNLCMVCSKTLQAPRSRIQRTSRLQMSKFAVMIIGSWCFSGAWSLLLGASFTPTSDDQPLVLPPPGAYQLHILSPTLLELTL